MLKQSLLLVLFCFMSYPILCQTKNEDFQISNLHNSIYIGYLGDNTFFGINYERYFFVNEKFMLAGKIGFAYNNMIRIKIDENRYSYHRKAITIPHYLTVNYRSKEKNYAEAGIGGLIVRNIYYPLLILGYRIHPLKSGKLNLRLNVVYPLNHNKEGFFMIPFGISSGIVF